MSAQHSPLDDSVLQPLLARVDRGLGAVQELLAVLREYDRDTVALVQQNQRLVAYAWGDPLTGLRNRRGLDEAITREEARIRRTGDAAAVVMADVTGLKRVNEQHGHLAGDELLRAVAQALSASARESDVLARFGGDEFVALLPGADLAGGEAFVARLRASAQSISLADGIEIPIHLKIGLATSTEAGSLAGALALADQRLIQAKERGSDANDNPA
jgi:diguanylate cyclase (GGDEF)-like protein